MKIEISFKNIDMGIPQASVTDLFNKASGPKELPQFKLNSQDLLHKSEVKFLTVYFTTKPNWKRHLETILSKARKGFN